MKVIEFKNLTSLPLPFTTIGISEHQIAASGQVDLTEGNLIGELQDNVELLTYLVDASGTLIIDGTQLTRLASINALTSATHTSPIVVGPTENRRLFGGDETYPNVAKASAGEVQYTRCWFEKGESVLSFQTYIKSGSKNKNIKLGLYAQANPLNADGEPLQRVASTSDISLTSVGDESFITESLEAPYIIPSGGYYWIAQICDYSNVRLASSLTFNKGFPPVRWEKSVGTTLPAIATPLAKRSSVLYAAAILEV